MTTHQTIDGVLVSRELLELAYLELVDTFSWAGELRALLDAESAPCAKSQVEGKRERFQKWVMATKHPVYGFLDGRSLARGDDRTGYADEYVQGLWVAYLAFGIEQPQGEPVVWLDPLSGRKANTISAALKQYNEAKGGAPAAAAAIYTEPLYRRSPEQPAPVAVASRDESIYWLKRIDGIGQARAELIYSMGFRRYTEVPQS